jgi:hypothetical protein
MSSSNTPSSFWGVVSFGKNCRPPSPAPYVTPFPLAEPTAGSCVAGLARELCCWWGRVGVELGRGGVERPGLELVRARD